MAINKTTEIQEKFILDKLRFSVNEKYFGSISSSDLSMSYKRIEYHGGEGVDLHINNSNGANIDKNLKGYMSLNPLRWQELITLDFSREGIMGSIYNECKHYDFGKELYSALNDIYKKNILYLNVIEITKDKNKQAYNNYWKLRNMFNIFKKICETNVKDFKTKEYRDSIIVVMSENFPEHVNPKAFGLELVPENQPADLFTKWHWERQNQKSRK